MVTFRTNYHVLSYLADGKLSEVSGDEILLAAGKTPNTQDLGLDNAGVKIDEKKAVIVNNFYQTSQLHIFAVGDVNNLPLRLETTAGHEGTLAAENALKDATLFIGRYVFVVQPKLHIFSGTQGFAGWPIWGLGGAMIIAAVVYNRLLFKKPKQLLKGHFLLQFSAVLYP